MTDHTNPFAELADANRKQLRDDPEGFAHDLADQHFAEALDMLTENARETLVEAIYDDLRVSLPGPKFEDILDAYHTRLGEWFKQTPTELKED